MIVFLPAKVSCHDNGILLRMLVVILSAPHAAVAVAAIERNSCVVALTHLKRQERQAVSRSKALEHVEQLSRDPAAAAVGPHGDICDISLVEHDLQARVADHTAAFIQRHKEGRKRVVQLLGKHIARPRHREAGALQLRHRVKMLARHRYDAYRHCLSTHLLCLQPVLAPVGLRDQRHGQPHHALHLLGQEPRGLLRHHLRTLDDQFVVHL